MSYAEYAQSQLFENMMFFFLGYGYNLPAINGKEA